MGEVILAIMGEEGGLYAINSIFEGRGKKQNHGALTKPNSSGRT